VGTTRTAVGQTNNLDADVRERLWQDEPFERLDQYLELKLDQFGEPGDQRGTMARSYNATAKT